MPTLNYYISSKTQDIIDSDVEESIVKFSFAYRVPHELVRAIIEKESRYVPMAIRVEPHLKHTKWYTNVIPEEYKDNDYAYCSMGYMQVLFGVAVNLGYKGTPHELLSASNSILYGVKHLSRLLKRYDLHDTISSYNQGNPWKDKSGKYGNQQYVDDVLAIHEVELSRMN